MNLMKDHDNESINLTLPKILRTYYECETAINKFIKRVLKQYLNPLGERFSNTLHIMKIHLA